MNRQYNQELGRFHQLDPVVGTGPQRLNRYTYSKNDPINIFDPKGTNLALVDCRAGYYADEEGWNIDSSWEVCELRDDGPTGLGPNNADMGQGSPTGDARTKGIAAAKEALKRQACKDAIAGVFGGNPLELFEKLLQKGQFVPGRMNDPVFNVPSGGTSYSPAYTNGTGESATIVYDPGNTDSHHYRGGFIDFAQNVYVNLYHISPAEGVALGFLHELSHATGRYVHPNDALPSDKTEVIGQTELRNKLYEACFKPEEKKKK
jgi:hypothetical protein